MNTGGRGAVFLFFPLLLLLAWRVRRSSSAALQRAAVLATVSAVLLLSFLACVLLTSAAGPSFGNAPANNRFAFFGSPTLGSLPLAASSRSVKWNSRD